MSKDYKLSIIMPTRNRTKYALAVIESIICFKRTDIEIIVQDNSDDKLLEKEIFKYYKDDRVKYFYESKKLSFVENFNRAVINSSGEYLVIIGDDDAVLSQIMDVVDWASENEIKAIQYNRAFSYIWPNESTKEEGELILRGFNFKTREVNPNKRLTKMLKNGDFIYNKYKILEAYHGIIKRDLFEDIYEKNGFYFGGLTPDIYVAIALTVNCQKYTYIDYPFTYHGVCPKSGSSDSKSGKHTDISLKNAPHFVGHVDYKWNKIVPEFYSVDTIWGETAIKSIIDNDHSKILLNNLNKQKMYKRLLLKYSDFDFITNKSAKDNNIKVRINIVNKLWLKLRQKVSNLFSFGIRAIKYSLYGRKVHNNVVDTNQALTIINNNRNFNKNTKKLKSFLGKNNG